MSAQLMNIETETQGFGDHQFANRHRFVLYAYLWAQFFSEDRTIVTPLKEATYKATELLNMMLDRERTGVFQDAPTDGQAFFEWTLTNAERLRHLDEDMAEYWKADQVKFLVQ
ncbi:MAG: hypothetical protein WAO76_07145 [Georgfuchsia sp.]